MSDDGHEGTTAARMGERVARVETMQEYLKRDTEAIRVSQHALAGEMQKFVIAEQKMTNAIETLITTQTNTQQEMASMAQAIRSLGEITATFMTMKTDLINLVEEQHKRIGAWGLATKVGAIVIGFVTVVGGIVAIIAHFGGLTHD
jgi:prophage DNA circulation protein